MDTVVHVAVGAASFATSSGQIVAGIASVVLAAGATWLSRFVEDRATPLRRRSDVRILVDSLRTL